MLPWRKAVWPIAALAMILVWSCSPAPGHEPEPSSESRPTAPATPTPQPSGKQGPAAPGAPPATVAPLPGAGAMLFDFAGQPTEPTSLYALPQWDVQVHSRDSATWEQLEAVHAEHGPGCEPPTQSHVVQEYERAVFHCRDHMMTSINAPGYGAIYLTPDYMADWSNAEAVISFDISTFRASSRDWWDVWITPFEDNLALPLEPSFPDLQGPPRRAIVVSLGSENQVCIAFYQAHVAVENWTADNCEYSMSYDGWLTQDKARRDNIEIRIGRDRVSVGMPAFNQWWHRDSPAPAGFDWTQGIVQFGHHSYTPDKCEGCAPGTWHWDNLRIEPGIPFHMIRAEQRSLGEEGTITFPSAAPEDAFLRFAAIGVVEVSFDDGKTWAKAERQAQLGRAPEHFSSYWTPIPAGTSAVKVRFAKDDWYEGPFHARDFAVWAAP